MDSSKRNKSVNPNSARKSSSKRNSFGESSEFPIRHLTKSEYMKVRNIPLLEPDVKKHEDLNPSVGVCQPTTNPRKFMKIKNDESIRETTKKKGHENSDMRNGPESERELQDERKINKNLENELNRVQNEKEDLLRQIKQLDQDHSNYHDKMQDSYQQKIHNLQEELEKSTNHSKEQDEYINNNRQLRKDNEALLKENRELKNFKENTLAENHPEKTKALLEEKDRRFKNLEILFNNEKETNELMKERNRQLSNENQLFKDQKIFKNEGENPDFLQDKIRQIQNENLALKAKNYELETFLSQKNVPNQEFPEKLTMLTTEISRLQFLLKEKDLQHEKDMKERDNAFQRELRDRDLKHDKELRDKDLKHEKEMLDLKQNIQPALKMGIEKELKELTDHFNDQKKIYDADVKNLRAKVAELEEKNLENRSKLEKFHLTTPELVKENELWRQKCNDLERDNKLKSQELNDLKNKDFNNVDLLKSNLDQNKKKENSFANDIMALQQALMEKDKEIIALRGKTQGQATICDQLVNENNKKNQDLMNLDRQNKDLMNEMRNLQKNQPLFNEERKKEFNEKIKDLEGKITLMINENQRLTELIKEKVGENEYLANILKDKLNENDQLKKLLGQTQNLSSANVDAIARDLENQKNKEIEAAIKEITLRFLQEKAENDKEIARLKLNLNELQRKLFEKEEEANFHKKRSEETLKKAAPLLNNHVEDENRFLQQEKKNLEGKIMQLLSENEKMKRKFDDVLQEGSVNRSKNLENSPNQKKPELISQSQLKGANDRIVDLEDKLQYLEREKQKLINNLGEKQRDNEILASKLNLSEQLKEKEIDELKRLLDKENQEKVKRATPQDMKKMENKMNDLEKQVGLLERELDQKNKELKGVASELEKSNAKSIDNNLNENDFNSCFEENVKLAAAQSAMEGEIFKLDQKILDLQNHNKMLKSDISRLEDENHLKNKEIDDWKNKLFSMEEKQMKELEDLRKQMENYKRQNLDVRELNNKFASEKENYENQLNMFKKLIDNKEKELEKTYDLLNLRKKELETLSKEYNDLKNDKLELSLSYNSKFNSNVNPEFDSLKNMKNLADENEELKKLLMHYKSQSEKKDMEYMKKSQELGSKIQDLNQLKSKYMPDSNPKIRYYSPTPTRQNNQNSRSPIQGVQLNFDYTNI